MCGLMGFLTLITRMRQGNGSVLGPSRPPLRAEPTPEACTTQQSRGRQGRVWPVLTGRFPNHVKLYRLPWAGINEGKREGPGIRDINTNGDPFTQKDTAEWESCLLHPPAIQKLAWLKLFSLGKIRLQCKGIPTVLYLGFRLWVLTLFLDSELNFYFNTS